MMPSTKSRAPLIVFCSLLVMLAIEAIFCYGKIAEAREEREAMEKIALDRAEKLKALEDEAEHLKRYINQMLKNPEFADMEMRRRLGYAQEGELSIREEDSESSRNPLR